MLKALSKSENANVKRSRTCHAKSKPELPMKGGIQARRDSTIKQSNLTEEFIKFDQMLNDLLVVINDVNVTEEPTIMKAKSRGSWYGTANDDSATDLVHKCPLHHDEKEKAGSLHLDSVEFNSIHSWLAQINMEYLTHDFIYSGYDSIDYIKQIIEEEDFSTIGITSPIVREVLCDHINKLQSPPPLTIRSPQEFNAQYLTSLCRLETYLSSFVEQGYDCFETITKLSYLSLIVVLNIHLIGHRRRILYYLDLAMQKFPKSKKKPSCLSGSNEQNNIQIKVNTETCDGELLREEVVVGLDHDSNTILPDLDQEDFLDFSATMFSDDAGIVSPRSRGPESPPPHSSVQKNFIFIPSPPSPPLLPPSLHEQQQSLCQPFEPSITPPQPVSNSKEESAEEFPSTAPDMKDVVPFGHGGSNTYVACLPSTHEEIVPRSKSIENVSKRPKTTFNLGKLFSKIKIEVGKKMTTKELPSSPTGNTSNEPQKFSPTVETLPGVISRSQTISSRRVGSRMKRNIRVHSHVHCDPEAADGGNLTSVWIHDPDQLLQSSVVFSVLYLGMHPITNISLRNKKMVQVAFEKLKASSAAMAKIPQVNLLVSAFDIRLEEGILNSFICNHSLNSILFCAQDPTDQRVFCYVYHKENSEVYLCNVFRSNSVKMGAEAVLAIGYAFQLNSSLDI